ncbi:MAG: hypothetical protein ACPIOQ_35105 [Promethearchaeia archaeon]
MPWILLVEALRTSLVFLIPTTSPVVHEATLFQSLFEKSLNGIFKYEDEFEI